MATQEQFEDLYYDIIESDFMKRKVFGDLVYEMRKELKLTSTEFDVMYSKIKIKNEH